MTIVWREVTILRLERARAYIAQEQPGRSRTLLREDHYVRSAISPIWGGQAVCVEDMRELVVPDTRYILAYTVIDDQVVFIAVQHSAQKWPERFFGTTKAPPRPKRAATDEPIASL